MSEEDLERDAARYGRYYDRAGQQITMMQWAHLRETGGLDYLRVAHEPFAEGISVSTVWLGIDHNFHMGGPPLIFETMVFGAGSPLSDECWRYSTEEQALAGQC